LVKILAEFSPVSSMMGQRQVHTNAQKTLPSKKLVTSETSVLVGPSLNRWRTGKEAIPKAKPNNIKTKI
jgi:hypothetical protein